MKNYEIKQVMYYEPANKIWGWMVPTTVTNPKNHARVAYAFWAIVGKTVSINKHAAWRPEMHMDMLAKKKAGNKYVEIPVSEFEQRWPDFEEAIEQRILFMTLSDGFAKQ